MSFIDKTYIENAITPEMTAALFPSDVELSQFITEADARVTAECHRAGYTMVNALTPPVGVAGDILRAAALYVVVMNGSLLRRNIIQDFAAITGMINPALIGRGEYPLPGLTPTQLGAVGGAKIDNRGGPKLSLDKLRGM